jgi:choline dehydrogenase
VDPSRTYDYVIVGAGSAGCVLANRLSEDPAVHVLLLEAGPSDTHSNVRIPAAFPRMFQTALDWNYHTEPQPPLANRRLFWPRGKMLGGCSSMNAQMYVRGQAADYDGWAALGNPGWSYAEVAPYFERIERRVTRAGTTRGAGPLYVSDQRSPSPLTDRFLQAAVECGLRRNDDYNGVSAEGVGYTQVTQRRGRRWSAADGYLRTARRRRNLTIETHCQVSRVVFEGRRAVGVEYRRREHDSIARAREVVLAAGAINSPQLLLLSGIGPAAELRALGIDVLAESAQVGEQLKDHLAVPVIVDIRDPISLVVAESPINLARFLLMGRGMLTSNVAEGTGFVRSPLATNAADLQLIFGPVPFINHGLVPPTRHGITAGAVLLEPRSTGRLSLASRDPAAAPRIDPRYLTHPDDLQILLHGVRLAQRILHAPAFASAIAGDFAPEAGTTTDEGLTVHIARTAETLYHPCGTCRMGTDERSVVDPQLRVRGVERLRVIDASVFPAIPRGNTHAPTVMLAEKAADLLRASLPT